MSEEDEIVMKAPIVRSQIEDDEIDIGLLLARLWAGRLWIILFTALAATGGLIVALGTPPTYRADAVLQLEEKKAQLALPAALTDLTSTDPRSVTEIEILKSRMVLGQAVADAHVDWIVTPKRLPMMLNALAYAGFALPENQLLTQFVRRGEAVRLDLLEVPARWIGETFTLTTGVDGRFALKLPDGGVRDGIVDETLSEANLGFALRIGAISAAPGRVFQIRHISENSAIRALRGRLVVAERGRQSGVLEISLTG
ncbi:MAG: Wzz/FepE/Etk N-terminal domain-containing protein, partial [Paracoccaceae bacterium]|nr:Wzz/FepE/Etk N-terminal domain-containing protein [Paracoccaceae bacterium]